jgi:hypothetical protein
MVKLKLLSNWLVTQGAYTPEPHVIQTMWTFSSKLHIYE